jgi:outer membrane protein TolC
MINVINMKWLSPLIIIFLILGTQADTAAQETLVIDLNKAFELALDRNESILIARKEMDRANARIMEAVSGALPQITAGVTYIRNWEVPTGVFELDDEVVRFRFGTENNIMANITLNQPLYSGGRTGTALSIASTARKLVRESVKQAGQELKFQVYNAFYGALLAQNVLRVNEESQRLAEDNLDRVEKMFNQGVSAEFDLLRARVAVANLQPTVIRARSDAEVALSALRNMLGIELEARVSLEAEFDSSKFIIPPVDEKEAEEIVGNRPELIMSDLDTEIRRKMISLATAGYRPTLNFSSTLQYQRQYDSGGIFDKSWDRSLNSVISLSVPIFDSWRTPSQVKQARVEYAQRKLQDQAIHKALVLDFEQSLGRYMEARNRLSAQGDAVELARRGLAIANVRFESGVGTQLEVADARLSLSVAEINRAVAYHDLAISYAAFLRSMGKEINP